MKTRKRTLLAVPGRLGIVLLLLVAALGAMPAPVTRAATFDIADGDVAGLIAAINTANGNDEADTINLAAGGTYTLTAVDNNTDGPNGLPSILADSGNGLTINGNGATIQRSSAGGTPDFRILHVAADGNLTLNDLTITNGKTPDGTAGNDGGYGGGIYNQDDLTLTDSTVSGNSTGDGDGYGYGGWGGGIYNYEGTVEITNSTVSDNSTGDGGGWGGGGIYSKSGTVEITSSTLSGNSCGSGYFGGDGGGIYNIVGTLEITNSTLSGNSGGSGHTDDRDGDGGGLFSGSCSPVITNVTFSGNVSQDQGGGMRHIDTGSPTLTNVTFSGNTATNQGGGIFMQDSGTLTLINCTITDNTADSDGDGDGDGGGIYRWYGTVNLKNTIIAGNADPSSAPDCSGTLISQGYNLIQDTTGCTISGDTTGNITGQDPTLGPLANNGGDTWTHALLAGSPAIDAIPEAAGGGGYNGAPSTDQRGVSRPQPAGGDCDIGAYEAGPPILRVSKAGSGDGTVTSDVAGINCGADCAEWYDEDTTVTLTATPDRDSIFVGWSGDCDANGQVTMDADKACTATFNLPVVPVGGVTAPASLLVLLWPWVALAAAVGLGSAGMAAALRKRSGVESLNR